VGDTPSLRFGAAKGVVCPPIRPVFRTKSDEFRRAYNVEGKAFEFVGVAEVREVRGSVSGKTGQTPERFQSLQHVERQLVESGWTRETVFTELGMIRVIRGVRY
jgi:hypothetical protein